MVGNSSAFSTASMGSIGSLFVFRWRSYGDRQIRSAQNSNGEDVKQLGDRLLVSSEAFIRSNHAGQFSESICSNRGVPRAGTRPLTAAARRSAEKTSRYHNHGIAAADPGKRNDLLAMRTGHFKRTK